ncbi:MAG: ribosome maturation factor RimM [Candidatus Melainabacteria bacterium]|nr:ribosome maturation factor RimM [Candidatus Melainabacteria bacterium]
MSEYTFPVGKIVGFIGLKGDMKIRPETNNPELLLDIDDVEVLRGGQRQKFEVTQIKLEKRMLILKLKGFIDRTSVEHFMDSLVFTTREQLNELDEEEWWVDDLVGLPVFTPDGNQVGTVNGITGANGELLEVKSLKSEGTMLIPFVKALVPVVDMKARRIEVVDLPGLLEPS